MKLNLGCGANKIPGFINVDVDPKMEPDVVFNFTGKFPYKDGEVEEVVAYHVLEHIPKSAHPFIYDEIYRVLQPGGFLTLSFPEFTACYENWKSNYRGLKDFWEATLYGRQASPSDFHVCIMEREVVARQLVRQGFGILVCDIEPLEKHNSVVKALKMDKFTYQQAMAETLSGTSGIKASN